MSDDLAARILAAIEETERKAADVLDGARRNGKNTARATLIRCAADRKIVATHRQVEADGEGDEPTGCVTCHNDPDCQMTNGHGDCGTMLYLAEGYGITP